MGCRDESKTQKPNIQEIVPDVQFKSRNPAIREDSGSLLEFALQIEVLAMQERLHRRYGLFLSVSDAWLGKDLGADPSGIANADEGCHDALEIYVAGAWRPAIRIRNVHMEETRAAIPDALFHVRFLDIRVEGIVQNSEVICTHFTNQR